MQQSMIAHQNTAPRTHFASPTNQQPATKIQAPAQVPRKTYYRTPPPSSRGGFFRGRQQFSAPRDPRFQVPWQGGNQKPSRNQLPPKPSQTNPASPKSKRKPITGSSPKEQPHQVRKKTSQPKRAPHGLLGIPSELIELVPSNTLSETTTPSELKQHLEKQPEPVQPFGTEVQEEETPPTSTEKPTASAEPLSETGTDEEFDPSTFELLPTPKLDEPDLNAVDSSLDESLPPQKRTVPPKQENNLSLSDSKIQNENNFGPMLEFDSSALNENLKLIVDVADRVQVGSGALFEIFIENKSTESFQNVTLKAAFSEALFLPERKVVDVGRGIPQIDPGEKIKVPLTLFSEKTGSHCVRFSLLNQKQEEINWNSSCVLYVPEVIRTEILGQELSSLDSQVAYTVLLKNLSAETARQVHVELRHDPILKFLEASIPQTETAPQLLTWKVDQIKSGEVIPIQVHFQTTKESHNSSLMATTKAEGHPQTEVATFLTIQKNKGPLDLGTECELKPVYEGEEFEIDVLCRNRGLETLEAGTLQYLIPAHLKLIEATWLGQEELQPSLTSISSVTDSEKVPAIRSGAVQRFNLKLRAVKPGQNKLTLLFEDSDSNSSHITRELPLIVLSKP